MTDTRHDGTQTPDATIMRNILQGIALAGIRCREYSQLKNTEQAEQALARARELYDKLVAIADLENSVHRSIVRNRRVDLATMVAEVESCRLRHETEKLRRTRRKAEA